MAEQEKDVFPRFEDGDVFISDASGRAWRLHSSSLRYASKAFAGLLADNTPSSFRKAVDSKTVWRVMLTVVKEENGTDRVSLEIQAPPDKNKFVLPSNTNGTEESDKYLRHYDNFFKCVYNIDPNMRTGDLNQVLNDSISLLKVADDLMGDQCVIRVIESFLLREGNALWMHIYRSPEQWCDMAVRLRSPIIFREAFCHVVGAWNMRINHQLLDGLFHGPMIIELAFKKIRALNQKKRAIEEEMVHHLPLRMKHNTDATTGQKPMRAHYASDIYHWQALMLVREFITTHMFRNHHEVDADMGARFYRQIGIGKVAYLFGDDLEPFFRDCEMSPRGKEAFNEALVATKEDLSPFVQELLVKNTQLSKIGDAPNLRYLTCCHISDEELPWVVKEE